LLLGWESASVFFGEQGAVQRLDLLFFFKIAKAYQYVCVSLETKCLLETNGETKETEET
jgi:hypothetical protein